MPRMSSNKDNCCLVKHQTKGNISALEVQSQKSWQQHSQVIHHKFINVKNIKDMVVHPKKLLPFNDDDELCNHQFFKSTEKRRSLQAEPRQNEARKRNLRRSATDLTSKREVFPPPPAFDELSGLDLSHLTPEERAVILQVAARAKQVEHVENKKLEKIQKQVDSFSAYSEKKEKQSEDSCLNSKEKQKFSNDHVPLNIKDNSKTVKEDDKDRNNHNIPASEKNTENIDDVNKTKCKSKPQITCSSTKVKNKGHLQCHTCSKSLDLDKPSNDANNTRKKSIRKSTSLDISNCSACQLPTCGECSSPSVLAKKGERLCQRCLKQRELAARSNMWMKDKRNLHRSTSEQMSKKFQELSAIEEASNSSMQQSSRGRSLSTATCTSSNSSKLSTSKDFLTSKDSKATIDGGAFTGMSVAEELIRRNSQCDDTIPAFERQTNSDKKQTEPNKISNPNEKLTSEENRLVKKEAKSSVSNSSKNSAASHKTLPEKSIVNKRKSVDQLPSNPKSKQENELKMDDLVKITNSELENDSLQLTKSQPTITEKSKNTTNADKIFVHRKSSFPAQDCFKKSKPNSGNKTSKIGQNDKSLADMRLKEKENNKSSASENKKDLKTNNLSTTNIRSTNNASNQVSNSTGHSAMTEPTAVYFVVELKKFFENGGKPLASEIKRINIDSKRSYESKKGKKSYIDTAREFTQGHMKNKVHIVDNKSKDKKIKFDHLIGEPAVEGAIKPASDGLKVSSIKEKPSVMTSLATDVGQTRIEEKILKVNSQAKSLKEEKVRNFDQKLSSNPSPLTHVKIDPVKPNDNTLNKSPQVLITPVSMPAESSMAEKEKAVDLTVGNNKPRTDHALSSIGSTVQELASLEITAVSREDDKTSCSRTTSVVSSLAESEGPAEWSVDEMDDGDTLFLVTSSDNGDAALPSGITTPNNLRTVTSEEGVYTSALIANSFEIISEENDTEGDFSHFVSEKEEKFSIPTAGLLKRTSQFADLKQESALNDNENEFQMTANEGKTEIKSRDHHYPKKERSTEIEDLHKKLKYSFLDDSNLSMTMPGDALFKKTKCELDEEIDFLDEQFVNQSSSLKKFFPLEQTKESNSYPIPAQRSQTYVTSPALGIVTSQTRMNNNKRGFCGESDVNNVPQLPILSEASPPSARLQNKANEAPRMVTKIPNNNKYGTKILQTPSGARLPISPLAKHSNISNSSREKKATNPLQFSLTAPNPGPILAVCGRSYFDSDSDEELSDSDEEHNFLLSATTSKPIHPEQMESSNTKGNGSSFFFRRTTSTDNFETLLKTSDQLPRSARRTASHPTRAKDMKYSGTMDATGQQPILTYPPIANPNTPTLKPETDVGSVTEGPSTLEPGNRYLTAESFDPFNQHQVLSEKVLSRSRENLSSPKSSKTSPMKKNIAVVWSSEALNKSHLDNNMGGISRCVSCGFLAAPVTKPASTIVENEPLRKSNRNRPKDTTSVNSSTQVTPDKETAPFNIASIDLCQLTALIQALKTSSDISDESKKHQVCEKTITIDAKRSTVEDKRRNSPVTNEPQSARPWASSRTMISRDVGTETCSESERILTPRDRIMSPRPFKRDGFASYPGNDYPNVCFNGKTDAGVGTEENELLMPRNIPSSLPKYSRSLSDSNYYNENQMLYPCYTRNYPYYRYPNNFISAPYDNPRPYFGPSRFGLADRHKPPHRDYCFERRTTIGEVETHSNLHENLAQMNQNRRSQNFNPAAAPLPLDRYGRENYSRIPSYGRYHGRQRHDMPSPFDQHSDQDDFFYAMKFDPSTQLTPSPNPPIHEIHKPLFEIQPQDTSLKMATLQPYRIEQPQLNQKSGFQRIFLNQDPALTRSASVPVVNHSVVVQPSSTYHFSNREDRLSNLPNPQSGQVSFSNDFQKDFGAKKQAFVDPNVTNKCLPPALESDFLSVDSFQHTDNFSISPGTSSNVLQIPQAKSPKPSGLPSTQSASFAMESSKTNYPPSSFRSEISSRTNYSTWTRPSITETSTFRSERLPSSNLEDGFIYQQSATLPYSENRPVLRTGPLSTLKDPVRGDSQRFRQTLEDLEQEEKELDMKLRYLELGRGRNTSTSSFTNQGNKTYSTSSAARNYNESKRDELALLETIITSSGKSYSDAHNTATPKYTNSSSRFATDSRTGPPYQQKNYVVVNNVDQIFDDERRRRRRKDGSSRPHDVARTSRSTTEDRYWQSPQHQMNSGSSLFPSRGKPSEKPSYRIRSPSKQPNLQLNHDRSPTFHKNSKTFSNEHFLLPTAGRGRFEDFCDRNCPQDYYSGQPSPSKNPARNNYSGHKKHPSATQHVHKRNSNNECKICTAYHPSSPRCYQVNYVMQDPDDVMLPWKKVVLDKEKRGPVLVVDNYQQLDHKEGSKFSPIFKPNKSEMEECTKISPDFRYPIPECINGGTECKSKYPSEPLERQQNLSTKNSCQICHSEVAEKSDFNRDWLEAGRDIDSSDPTDDSRNVVSDTEEYNLRKEQNIDWFDKPSYQAKDIPAYAEFSNNKPTKPQKKH